jgi:hypothetical protein
MRGRGLRTGRGLSRLKQPQLYEGPQPHGEGYERAQEIADSPAMITADCRIGKRSLALAGLLTVFRPCWA